MVTVLSSETTASSVFRGGMLELEAPVPWRGFGCLASVRRDVAIGWAYRCCGRFSDAVPLRLEPSKGDNGGARKTRTAWWRQELRPTAPR